MYLFELKKKQQNADLHSNVLFWKDHFKLTCDRAAFVILWGKKRKKKEMYFVFVFFPVTEKQDVKMQRFILLNSSC